MYGYINNQWGPELRKAELSYEARAYLTCIKPSTIITSAICILTVQHTCCGQRWQPGSAFGPDPDTHMHWRNFSRTACLLATERTDGDKQRFHSWFEFSPGTSVDSYANYQPGKDINVNKALALAVARKLVIQCYGSRRDERQRKQCVRSNVSKHFCWGSRSAFIAL